jgi:hypothetical protein
MSTGSKTQFNIPVELDDFWREMRLLIREELKSILAMQFKSAVQDTTGFQVKPLYSMDGIRALFDNVSRSTIYDWINCGKLKPRKLKGKVYFFWKDIEKVLSEMD